MAPKRKKNLDFKERIRLIHRAGLGDSPPIYEGVPGEKMEPLSQRIQKILGLSQHQPKANEMIYFVMYDIENNKVRAQIAKYLIKKGCTRVQKSIFLANTSRQVYDQIKNDLQEVNNCYENNDSIFLVPVSTDEIKSMKVIGQNVDFDLILRNRNTLFF